MTTVIAQPGGPVVVIQPEGLPLVTITPPASSPVTVIQPPAGPPLTVLQSAPPAPLLVINPSLSDGGLDLRYDQYERLILDGGPPTLTNGA